jgi:NTP pyrophosphatase (non-canonical NTP hydrolase)
MSGQEGVDYDHVEVGPPVDSDRQMKMDAGRRFDAYQAFTRTVAIYPGHGEKTVEAIVYCMLKMCGETGEIAEKLGKLVRGRGFQALTSIDDETREALSKELGDVLWYVASLADELGLKLSGVASLNVSKLSSRKERGVLHGSGDNR